MAMDKFISRQKALQWSKKCEPIFWTEHSLTVVRDGCDPWDGTRIHFVKEQGHTGGLLNNAYVFSIK